jgi:hypothetical protein
MIEITFTEMVLLAWAVLATAAAFKYKDDARAMKRMLVIFVENRDAREQLIKAHEEFMKEQT